MAELPHFCLFLLRFFACRTAFPERSAPALSAIKPKLKLGHAFPLSFMAKRHDEQQQQRSCKARERLHAVRRAVVELQEVGMDIGDWREPKRHSKVSSHQEHSTPATPSTCDASTESVVSEEKVRETLEAAVASDELLTILAGSNKEKLLLAAEKGEASVVKALLGTGDSGNGCCDEELRDSRGSCGFTALHYAASRGHVEVVQVLLQAGADLDTACWAGDTALHLAAYGSHTRVLKLLLEKGAHVDARNEQGETPLFYAARRGGVEMLQALLDAGSDAGIVSSLGDQAGDQAAGGAVETVLGQRLARVLQLTPPESQGSRSRS